MSYPRVPRPEIYFETSCMPLMNLFVSSEVPKLHPFSANFNFGNKKIDRNQAWEISSLGQNNHLIIGTKMTNWQSVLSWLLNHELPLHNYFVILFCVTVWPWEKNSLHRCYRKLHIEIITTNTNTLHSNNNNTEGNVSNLANRISFRCSILVQF